MNRKYIDLEIQGGMIRRFTDLVLDYTGTLSLDGVLLPGVAERLAGISAGLRITIMTADTFGMAADQTKSLPVDFRIIKTGVGNGGNDVPMMDKAGLKIAVIGPEGVSAELFRVAKAVNLDIHIIAC